MDDNSVCANRRLVEIANDTADLLYRLDGWLRPDEGQRLADLAASVPGDKVIVELGTFCGKSTGYLAAGSLAGNHVPIYTCDPWGPGSIFAYAPGVQIVEAMSQIAQANLQAIEAHTGISITHFRMTSDEMYQGWVKPIGLMFLDTDKVHVAQDVDLWQPYLSSGGLIAIHDCGNPTTPEVKRAVERVVLRTGFWVDEGQVGSLRVLRRK